MSAAPPRPAAGRRLVVQVPRARRGQRLDRVLADLVPAQSRAALQRLARGGDVTIGGAPARSSLRLRGGERIVLRLPPPEPARLAPEAIAIPVLYEDEDVVVIDKPAGLVVHPGAGRRGGTLANALLHRCPDLAGIGGALRPGIVHRLDRETSGVLVVAKNDASHRDLAAQFKTRSVEKMYEALVWGRPPASGLIDRPIGRHPTARTRMAVRRAGRPARTGWRLRRDFGPVSLLEVRPETGRTHQIRVHLSHLGHPVVGDRLYGGARAGRPPAGSAPGAALGAFQGLALHARRLAFRHPRTGERRSFEAPRPPALAALLAALEAPAGGAGEAPAAWRPRS